MVLSTTSAAATEAAVSDNEDIPPEILAAIAAAAATFLGKRFHLLSVSNGEQVSRWTRQGRATIQASHNLRKKR